jgi:hypothetical protein
MQPIRKYWPYILVAVIAIAIPVSALLVEPGAKPAAASDEQFEKGILKRSDSLGSVWALQKASGPSALSFRQPGSPITVKTKVRRVNSGMASIELVLQGWAGETYRPIIRQNNSPLPAPQLRIIDKQGKVIDEGEFAYG